MYFMKKQYYRNLNNLKGNIFRIKPMELKVYNIDS